MAPESHPQRPHLPPPVRQLINCPKDHWLIGQISADGSFVGVCTQCKCRYGAQYGQLVKFRTSQPGSPPSDLTVLGRHYEFTLAQARGENYRLMTAAKPQARDFMVSEGDDIGLIFQAHADGSCKRLLKLVNQTTGRTQLLNSPNTDLNTAIVVGLIAAWLVNRSFVLVVSLVLGVGLASFLGWCFALVCGGVIGKTILESHQVNLTPQQERELNRDRLLLKQKASVVNRLTTLTQELNTAERQFYSLQQLYERMRDFDPKVYSTRISTLRRAGFLLRENIKSTQYLIEQYGKTIEMIEIEYESRQISHDFIKLSDSLIFQKLQEIKQAEARNQDIINQIQASDIVKRLTEPALDPTDFSA